MENLEDLVTKDQMNKMVNLSIVLTVTLIMQIYHQVIISIQMSIAVVNVLLMATISSIFRFMFSYFDYPAELTFIYQRVQYQLLLSAL